MKSAHCSINWGKSLAFVMLVIVFALTVILLGTLNNHATPNGIGVDWGSRPVPACPPGVKDCKVGVDWGSLTAPCLPTDSNCSLGPVAVDWGSIFSPLKKPSEPVKVAVDWGSRFAPLTLPCKPGDLKCKLEFDQRLVDWGS